MNLVLYLAGCLGCLFIFFYSMDLTSENTLFQYLGYTFLLLSFWFLMWGIWDFTSGRMEATRKREQAKLDRQQGYKTELQVRSGRRS